MYSTTQAVLIVVGGIGCLAILGLGATSVLKSFGFAMMAAFTWMGFALMATASQAPVGSQEATTSLLHGFGLCCVMSFAGLLSYYCELRR
jgi:hypothetical protein